MSASAQLCQHKVLLVAFDALMQLVSADLSAKEDPTNAKCVRKHKSL